VEYSGRSGNAPLVVEFNVPYQILNSIPSFLETRCKDTDMLELRWEYCTSDRRICSRVLHIGFWRLAIPRSKKPPPSSSKKIYLSDVTSPPP